MKELLRNEDFLYGIYAGFILTTFIFAVICGIGILL